MKDPSLLARFQDKFVLVIGEDDVLEVAISYGYKYAITHYELGILYPRAIPMEIDS
jgi:hypothetical protein